MKNSKSIVQFNTIRSKLNRLMQQHDKFFSAFGSLDDQVYAQGAIPKKV